MLGQETEQRMHAAAQLSSHAESCPGQDQGKTPPTVDGFSRLS